MEVFVRLRHSVCNLNTKEHKSKSAAITQTGNRVQDLAGVRNETKSSESKFGKHKSASVEFADQTGGRVFDY